jgi:SAM-dependent methyltransferase
MAQRGFERFIAQYEYIRASEQRGSPDSAYYLALPFADLSGRLGDQWKIRAITFQHIVREIVVPLAARLGRPLNILDLGAGNGWLSYRLSTLGHRPVAVDLLTNDRDGLGAAPHYAAHLPHLFPRVQADLDHLPFASASFDLALFNASFHYSEDFSASLGEALRCVRRGAPVVIADTPWYREERSGLEMVQEKRAHFLKTYGFASDALESQEFLTPDRLETLARELSVQWRVLKPWYGLHWALRPLRAKLQGRRTPSKFRIFVAKCTA